MIRRITDRMFLWLLAIVLLWALLAQPAFIDLGKRFETKYHATNSTACPTDSDRSSC